MKVENKPISAEEYGYLLIREINDLIQTGVIPLIYSNRDDLEFYPEHITELARIKRALEIWCADAAIRESVMNGETIMHDFDFEIDFEELRSLWDENAPRIIPSLSVLRYRAFNLEKLTHRNKMRQNDESSDKRYNTWRSRQKKRSDFQLRPLVASGIVHAPYCIELSQGCSVGCWFCGISAPKLSDIFFFTPENQQLFEDVLLALKRFFGGAVQKGFCYWATDPLDNPDYEKFLTEFHRITGAFPQTTTALALKDIDRTRSLLQLSQKLGGRLDRFSLLSLKQLQQAHRMFTPEELLFVELITQNKEAYNAKSKAGRAVQGAEKRASSLKQNEHGNKVADGTIACVSGFLISLVSKTVKLITPCEADDQWPLGYIILAEASFDNGAQFDEAINRMAEEQMAIELPESKVISFYNNSICLLHDDGFSIQSKYTQKSFRSNTLYRELGILIDEGVHTAGKIEEILEWEKGYHHTEIKYLLKTIYNEGIIKEQPCI